MKTPRFPTLFSNKITRFPIRLVLFIILLISLLFAADRFIPPQHLPWRPIDMDAPTGFATDMQLFRLSLSPNTSCSQLLDPRSDYQTRVAEPFRPQAPCGWDVAREVDGNIYADLVPNNVTLQCPLAVGMYIWTREVDFSAREHLGTGVKSILHAGSYSCRRQVGNDSGEWSEHAYANAFDVMGFELEDGRVISVLSDWNGGKKEKRFLRDIRRQGCKIFRVTLSPDFNAAHADHFHFDMGPRTACR